LCFLEKYFTSKITRVVNEKEFDRRLACWIDVNRKEKNGFDVYGMNFSIY